ncbi:GMC oxidoreductase [Bimuria novae-zelandiae CBS 107.79]|uniref:GMC oxidoreductase n=1 Tax=Bimuria novae-zelandiae CBS 107.79 TaxID=1447943 RepID=A0A6A5VCM9_9PLEO|nr:GMC oxidoreductase [Bimuria novae-zelandiae CBS 107.79]
MYSRISTVALLARALSDQAESYDYLLAGAGTAGLVIACRLSENPKVSVLVIESGPDVRNDGVVTSGNFSFTGANDRVLSYRAGKAVGGRSIVNGMVYIRGEQAQFDAFEKLGDSEWNWDSLFSYGKKGERFEGPDTAQKTAGVTANPADHGTNGSLTTWKSIGVNPVTDINGGNPHGFVSAPQTLDRDKIRRSSSAAAYYKPVDSRPNLKVIQGNMKRIIWANEKKNRAVASGFYAKEEKLGVKVKSAMPGVGENMQDHNAMVIGYGTANTLVGDTPFATLVTAQDALGNKMPVLAASSRSQISTWAQAASTYTGGAIDAKTYEKRFQIQHDLIFKQNVTIAELFPTNLGSAIVSQLWTTHPFSWSSVHLKSLVSFDDPVIDPNIFSLQFDIDMLVAVARKEQKAYSTPPLSTFVAPNQVLPTNATDEQWTAYVQANAGNTLHVVDTCAMLPLDLGGIVDSKLKVYGTSNMRVVDASVIPVELTGHTTGPLYAVAEKAADIINNDS